MRGFISNGGVRKLLILLLGLMLASTVSCGGGGGVVRESDGAGRGANDQSGPNLNIVYRNGYQITVEGKDIQSVDITFTSGLHEVYLLSNKNTCFTATKDGIAVIKVLSKGGDYWYFDGMGNPIPDGDRQASGLIGGLLGLVGKIVKPAPCIQVKCTGGPYSTDGTKTTSALLGSVIVNVTSNVAFSQVKVATSTNTVLTYSTPTNTTSGSFDTQTTVAIDAVRVTLAADGSKWYFDAAGNLLPLDSKWYQDLD